MTIEWQEYEERTYGYDGFWALRRAWLKMSDPEKQFCNIIRSIYRTAILDTEHADKWESGSHLFDGGHVIIQDGYRWYKFWKTAIERGKLKGGERSSSHYGRVDAQQYEIILPSLGCILFGVTNDNDGDTWFQNESWQATEEGMPGWGKWVAHGVLGYGMHKISGNKQVGALGYSTYSEKTNKALTARNVHVPITNIGGLEAP